MTVPDNAAGVLVPPGAAEDLALLLPVGHALGATSDRRTGAAAYRVRVGPDVVTLTAGQYVLWGLAHGQPGREPGPLWGRAHVLTAAAALDLDEDALDLVDGLLDDGLLAEVEPGTDDVADFSGGHRLVPLMIGLGNTAERPNEFRIGLPETPLLTVSAFLYDLYAWGHLSNDLTAAVAASHDAQRNRSGPDGIGQEFPGDPDELLDAVVQTLHLFVGPNAAYLDARRPG